MEIEVRPLTAALGAELRGFHIRDLQAADIEQIRALLTEHLVLFFPDQHPTAVEHIAFGRHFGELESHPHLKNPYSDLPELFELSSDFFGIADEWHSDLTFSEEPSLLAILHMVKCPEVGGDTLWTNAYKAYEELSAPLQDLCEGISAVHDAAPHGEPTKTWIHPVVRVHPESGKKSLFINEHFTRRIVEMSFEESKVLLDYLTSWVKTERFTVRYHWQPGTLALWDNRCTQHFVLNDFREERVIQRVTVMGDQVVGARDQPKWEPYVRPILGSARSRHDLPLIKALAEREKRASPGS